MSLRAGIVGLPNVGKSTLFNALTAAQAAAANYPFCTVEPNSGMVEVPDPRLAALGACVRPERLVPVTLELVDIAGLVRGASKGEGLGNRFLAHIRETDAVVEVVRCFEDPNVSHVDGTTSAERDIETVETELLLADLETAERRLERARKAGKAGDEHARAEASLFEALVAHLSDGRAARRFPIPEGLERPVHESHLLTAKPFLYVANVDESWATTGNAASRAVEEHARREQARALCLCAKLEAELRELDLEERSAFLAELGLRASGLERLLREIHALLGLVTFFTTTGGKEVRAWAVRSGTTAREAAGKVHTDFASRFVAAEVVSIDEFLAAGGEAAARSGGRLRLEGRDYAVQDGDVIHFRAGA